jgi:hypothetical protein
MCHLHKLVGFSYKSFPLHTICNHAKTIHCTILVLLANFAAAMLLLLMIQDAGSNHGRPDKIIDPTTVLNSLGRLVNTKKALVISVYQFIAQGTVLRPFECNSNVQNLYIHVQF